MFFHCVCLDLLLLVNHALALIHPENGTLVCVIYHIVHKKKKFKKKEFLLSLYNIIGQFNSFWNLKTCFCYLVLFYLFFCKVFEILSLHMVIRTIAISS